MNFVLEPRKNANQEVRRLNSVVIKQKKKKQYGVGIVVRKSSDIVLNNFLRQSERLMVYKQLYKFHESSLKSEAHKKVKSIVH